MNVNRRDKIVNVSKYWMRALGPAVKKWIKIAGVAVTVLEVPKDNLGCLGSQNDSGLISS